MEIINSLSFRQAVLVAVVVAIIFTALFAWIYTFLTGKKSRSENKGKITKIESLKRQPTVILPDINKSQTVNNNFLEKIGNSLSELSLKIDYLENSFKVCSMITESISFGDVGSVTEFEESLLENSIKSKIDKLKHKGFKESDIATRLNLSSELKKLYFHAGKQRNKVRVG
ncbi:hypothetical protein J7M07_06335 [bacterium]|nr:hypothetical protein [bacterium]